MGSAGQPQKQKRQTKHSCQGQACRELQGEAEKRFCLSLSCFSDNAKKKEVESVEYTLTPAALITLLLDMYIRGIHLLPI